ncbi:MAG: dihydrodipicolinate synthase family protein [Pirellulaceae bacterium]
MSRPTFRLIAPPVTPFRADGQLNLSVVGQQAALLAETQVDGVFVAGTTGECASLTLDERLSLASRWMEAARPLELDVIVQVGDNCQSDAIRMAAHAQEIGADATAAYSPSYFRPADVEALIEFLVPVAEAAGDLPFYFYDIPPTTNVRLPMLEFLERAKPRIPNLVGIKYSNTDLVQLQECLRAGSGEYQVLFGCDEILITGIVLGVHGAIGSTYNFAGPLYRRMEAAFRHGDLATVRACQLRSVDLVQKLSSFGFLAALKETMKLFGIDCGPVRSPLRNLSEEQRERLRGELARMEVAALAQKFSSPAHPVGRH